MISLLKGEVFEVQDQSAIILCAGVGYEVNLAQQSVASLEKGQDVTLYITESLSPYDGTSLYGFLSKEEKQLFLLFKENISGTGPKKAMEFLSKALRSLPDFHRAISTKDPKILTAIFGFTAKTAQNSFFINTPLSLKNDCFNSGNEFIHLAEHNVADNRPVNTFIIVYQPVT